MAKTKTASVRLPKEMYEEIDNICDEIGCSRNDWIKDTLKDKLREESNENSPRQDRNTNPKPQKITVGVIDNEPKTHTVEVDFKPEDYEIDNSDKHIHEVEI